MSTLSIENRENLINMAERVFAECNFEACCQEISVLVHANFSDCIESLTEEQSRVLTEKINHVDYSLNMHKNFLNTSFHDPGDVVAKEALEIEIMPILRDWPVF